VTPIHIQPEWYFLFAYTILRRIPNKLGGVLLILFSILFLIIFPFFKKFHQSSLFKILNKNFFFLIFSNLILLTWIGIKIAIYPFSFIGILSTLNYFLFFIFYII
jgi:ubiquinol-cytochrome c reductase cytochrome b subunit